MCLFFTCTWKLQYFRKLRVLLKGSFPPVCVRQSDDPRSALKRLKKSANPFKVVYLFGFVTIRRYGNRNVWKASGNAAQRVSASFQSQLRFRDKNGAKMTRNFNFTHRCRGRAPPAGHTRHYNNNNKQD